MTKLLRTGLNAGTDAPQVVGGKGVYFHLSDGRRVLDGSDTGGPLGHGHPRMAAGALAQGAVIGTSGEQVSLFLAPPLVVSDAQAEELLPILDENPGLADREHSLTMERTG